MPGLVRSAQISGREVTDSGTLVLSSRDTTAQLDVEGMPVSFVFETTDDLNNAIVTMMPEGTGVAIIMRRAASFTTPYNVTFRSFATADDGRKLSLSLNVVEVPGDHGMSRLVSYTITAEPNG